VYHTLVLMVEKNVNIGEIKGELYKRHKWYNYWQNKSIILYYW
jgi:phosphoribosyl-ATP pyrophosphohydrolase